MDIEAVRRSAEHPIEAGRGDLPGVAADLSAAFSDDVMFDWFLRDDARRSSARLRFFRVIVEKMAFGAGLVFADHRESMADVQGYVPFGLGFEIGRHGGRIQAVGGGFQ